MSLFEAVRPVPEIRKTYQLRYRCDNGSAVFDSVNDTEGWELLTVRADGTVSSSIILGLCRLCWEAALYKDGRDDCGLGDQCPRVKSKGRDKRLGSPNSEPELKPEAPALTLVPEPGKDVAVHRRLVRMMPPPKARGGGEAVEVDVHDAGAPVPPVASAIEQAARELAGQIWFSGLIPRARLGPSDDQALAHAVAEKWLIVDEDRILRGQVDPRPVTVTRIPNF